MHHPRTLVALAGCALLGFAATANAQTYVGSAYEGFDYTSGQILNANYSTYNGGTGWNATGDSGSANTTSWGAVVSGTNAYREIGSGNLDYSAAGYPAETGNRLTVDASIAGSTGIGRDLGQTVDSGTLYFSYLTSKAADTVRTLNFSLFGSNERVAFGQIGPNTNLVNGGTANSGEFALLISNVQNATGTAGVYTAAAPIAYGLDTVHLVVGKIEFGFGGGFADRLTFYVDPASLNVEGTPYLTVDTVDVGALTSFRVFAGATSGGFNSAVGNFDEIRFGTSYASVTSAVPEPSTYAVGAGLVALFAGFIYRRRRAARG